MNIKGIHCFQEKKQYEEVSEVVKANAFSAKENISAGSITDLGDVELPFIAGRSRILDD
ncbi:MAG: hypothetical protein IJ796_08735 [Lachnospiraceae bacterium]|nr:hypothetical protein [Lachnospiraceae bacterium]